jgi:glutamyl-tRNA synthetase
MRARNGAAARAEIAVKSLLSKMKVRTRFAPSPTGFLHIGGARTALYSWAYARRQGGRFVLRVEDTDLERSTADSVQAILDSLRWLGLDWDEGPFFQMQRLARYQEVAEQLIASGNAYRCWASKEELDALRAEQRARNEKPRYDGRWRPERAKAAGLAPPDRPPVIRFRTPEAGEAGWHDLVKGAISFPNKELDDLVILRADGVPTYNFGVVVDDLDMDITHVIRGDDHVNNTPRQLHIFRALADDKKIPSFAHLPMILGADGERLSKRHGAVSVMQYRDEGFLPEALLNTLARLGWSHGDDELFSVRQLVEWFDLGHVSHSAAKFDPEKALWVNQQHIKTAKDERLAALLEPFLEKGSGPPLDKVVALLKDRANSLRHLAEAAHMFYAYETPPADKVAELVNERTRPALKMLQAKLAGAAWERKALGAAIGEVLKAAGLKMPELAMPARLLITGRTQTPSLDAVLELLGRDAVMARLATHLQGD